MPIFAAGIVAIPDEIHDAALLDGCTLKKIIYITKFPSAKYVYGILQLFVLPDV